MFFYFDSDFSSHCTSIRVCYWSSKNYEQVDEHISSSKNISKHET